jgi:hypothetical protein
MIDIDVSNLTQNVDKYTSLIGTSIDLRSTSHEDRILIYQELLIGSMLIRGSGENAQSNSSILESGIRILRWLDTTDFYDAPASTKYHESYPGGLLEHSLKVYNSMISLHHIPQFNDQNLGSCTLVALVHDWCKIGKYESYIKNVKDPITKQWKEERAYKCTDKYLGLGHGPQSLMMISQFCNTSELRLSFDEMAAIRWHMYTYDVTSYDINDLNRCNQNIPIVLLTQFADQLASAQFNKI